MKNHYLFLGYFLMALGLVLITAGSLLGIPVILFGILSQLKGRGKIDSVFGLSSKKLPHGARVLRSSMIGYWLLIPISSVVAVVEEGDLPANILQFSETQIDMMPVWVMLLMILLLGLNLVASVGVFLFHSWARDLFASSLIGAYLIEPLMGTMVATPYYGMLDDVLDLVAGIILCLIYFSPVSEAFAGREKADELPGEDELTG